MTEVLQYPLRLGLLVPWTLIVLALIPVQLRALKWLRERVHHSRLGLLTRYAEVGFGWHLVWVWLQGALLIVASAGPGSVTRSVGEIDTRAIVLVVDASLSMEAADASDRGTQKYSSRFVKAKAFSAEVVDAFPEAQVGLITFSGDSFIHLPPTTDHAAVRLQLGSLTSHAPAQSNGSEFSSALGSVLHMQEFIPSGISVVLVSDGDTSSKPRDHSPQVELMTQAGIRVHTVVVGSDIGRSLSVFHPEDVINRVENKRIITKFQTSRDKSTLRSISKRTNGATVSTHEGDWTEPIIQAIEADPPKSAPSSIVSREDYSRWFLLLVFLMGHPSHPFLATFFFRLFLHCIFRPDRTQAHHSHFLLDHFLDEAPADGFTEFFWIPGCLFGPSIRQRLMIMPFVAPST